MNTRTVYNYKAADSDMSDRITSLEGFVNLNENETVTGKIESAITSLRNELQPQIDGNIQTWFYEGVPTLENAPASTWTTETLKQQHLGDIYYNTTTNFAYRFMATTEEVEGEDVTTYSWSLIKDSDITKALQDSADALDAIEDCVPLDMDSENAGRLLYVGNNGLVRAGLPNGIMMMDSTGAKAFYLTLDINGALTVSEIL